MTLAKYLKKIGMSQKRFARAVGVAQGTLSRIIRGGGCRVSTADAIVRATGGQVDYADLGPKDAPRPRVPRTPKDTRRNAA